MQPLGRPVLPLVKISRAMSSGLPRGAGSACAPVNRFLAPSTSPSDNSRAEPSAGASTTIASMSAASTCARCGGVYPGGTPTTRVPTAKAAR